MHLMVLAFSLALGVPTTASQKLEVRDIRSVFTPFGPDRPADDYFLPQDRIFFRFFILGAKEKGAAGMNLDISAKLADAKGKVLELKTIPLKGRTPFLTDRLWCYAALPIDASTTPGEHLVKVTVTDNNSGDTASFERKARIKPAEFAVRAIQFAYDADGKVPAPQHAVAGQQLFYRLDVIGADISQNRVDVTLKCEVVDSKAGEVRQLGAEGVVRRDGVESGGAVWFAGVTGPLLRPGAYQMRFTVSDRIANKTVRYEAPLHVSAP